MSELPLVLSQLQLVLSQLQFVLSQPPLVSTCGTISFFLKINMKNDERKKAQNFRKINYRIVKSNQWTANTKVFCAESLMHFTVESIGFTVPICFVDVDLLFFFIQFNNHFLTKQNNASCTAKIYSVKEGEQQKKKYEYLVHLFGLYMEKLT